MTDEVAGRRLVIAVPVVIVPSLAGRRPSPASCSLHGVALCN